MVIAFNDIGLHDQKRLEITGIDDCYIFLIFR
jgi:hypothetical protein